MAGKKQTPTNSPNKSSQSFLEIDAQMSPLPFVALSDCSRTLPRYTTILTRPADDGVTMEDLDALQQDLEKLLSNAVVRARALKAEILTLDQVEHKNSKKGKTKPLSLKRKVQESKNGNGTLKKRVPVNPLVSNLATKREVPKISYLKNDMSDKLWLSVEPYCADVSKDDVTFLDNIIKQCSESTDVKVPILGEHYFTKWVADITKQEFPCNPSSSSKSRRGKPVSNMKVDAFSGYLSQRLIAGLIEEDASPTSNIKSEDLKVSDYASFGGKNVSPNSTCIENTIRKELVEQGILDVDELPQVMEPDDHILQEIKKCAAQLRIVNKFNLTELNRLRNIAVKDLQRQKVKSSLAKVDDQVIDIANKLLAEKQEQVISSPDTASCSTTELEKDVLKILEQQATLHKEYLRLTDEISIK